VVKPGYLERGFVASLEITLAEVVITSRNQSTYHNESIKKTTYSREIKVVVPPISLTIVAIDCGAKKLISQEDAIKELVSEGRKIWSVDVY
jgi:hypothetical protein